MTGTKSPLKILLAGKADVAMLAAVRGLRAAGYEPWLGLFGPKSYASRSRSAAGIIEVPDPASDALGFVEATAAAARRLNVAAVLPGPESAVLTLAGQDHAFPAGVALGTNSPSVVDLATDKTRLQELASSAGLNVPETVTMSADDLAVSPTSVRYPAVVKAFRSEVAGTDGRLHHFGTARRADDLAALRSALEELPDRKGLVQSYLQGPLRGLSGLIWDGELLAAVHTVAPRIWPPDCGSYAYALTIPPQRDLELTIARVLNRIGWQGIFQADFVEHINGLYLIDLNPRIYTSLMLAVRAGANLPAIWVSLLLGRTLPSLEYRLGVRYRMEQHDVRALVWALTHGQVSAALKGALPRRKTVHAVFSLSDPMPSVTNALKLVERMLGYGGDDVGSLHRNDRRTLAARDSDEPGR